MNITKTDKGLLASVSITLEPADYTAKFEAALKKQAKSARVNGFRPGHVPAQLVKKMYGKAILVEEVDGMLSDTLFKYLQDNKLEILGEPLPSESDQNAIDWDKDTSFTFVFDIAPAPIFNIELEKLAVKSYSIVPTAEEINRYADDIAMRFGTNKPVEIAGEKDVLRGLLLQETAVDPEGIAHSIEPASILLSMVRDAEQKALFVGKAIGDEVLFNPLKAMGNETDVAYMLDVDKSNKDLMTADYRLVINEIMHFEPHAIDQELFDKAFGEGNVTNEEQMRENLKAQLAGSNSNRSDYRLSQDVRTALTDSISFEFPEEFLKRWLLASNRDNKEITPELIDKEFGAFLADLKWSLIKNKMAKAADIKVQPQELREAARQYTRMQLARYGMFDVEDEMVEKWSNEMLRRRDELNQLTDSVLELKLVQLYKASVKLQTIEISSEEFAKLSE